MNIVRKAWRRGMMLGSQVRISKGVRHVRHVHLRDFEMLAFANEDVGRQIWLFKSFEPDETQFFSNVIKADDICFDIGGNIGFFSLLMAKRAHSGKVHVFEPIPLNAAMIRANAELNSFKNIIVNNVAMGSEEGNATFSVSTDSAYSSMRATGRYSEAQSIEVPLFTLDSYARHHNIERIDVMKVDVEGAEEMVIKGGAELLQDSARRPRVVLLELYDLNLAPFNTSVSAIIGQMVAYGYEANVIPNGSGTLEPYMPNMANRFCNIIFTPKK
jgi:FkbM family methyltransferase